MNAELLPGGVAESIDYSEPIAVDPVEEALAANFRGLPLSYSKSAKAAAARYGLVMIGLDEDEMFHEVDGESVLKHYPGMADDAAIILFASLCAAEAGLADGCPPEMRRVLRRSTLSQPRAKLADLLMDFFDAFDLDIMETEVYSAGFGLMEAEAKSQVVPVKTTAPGKLGEVAQP